MKPTLHGLARLGGKLVTRVPTEKLNDSALMETFDAVPDVWLNDYKVIAAIYKLLFSQGELPDDVIDAASATVLEMAC